MTTATLTTTKVEQIADAIRSHSDHWDIVTVERRESGLWMIRAERDGGTLAQSSLLVFHTGRRFLSANYDLIGYHREYRHLRDFAIHHLNDWN